MLLEQHQDVFAGNLQVYVTKYRLPSCTGHVTRASGDRALAGRAALLAIRQPHAADLHVHQLSGRAGKRALFFCKTPRHMQARTYLIFRANRQLWHLNGRWSGKYSCSKLQTAW
jgi:hypothetical protein